MAARRAAESKFTTAKSTAAESCYQTRARLWRWQGGKGSWHFITLPVALAREKSTSWMPDRAALDSARCAWMWESADNSAGRIAPAPDSPISTCCCQAAPVSMEDLPCPMPIVR